MLLRSQNAEWSGLTHGKAGWGASSETLRSAMSVWGRLHHPTEHKQTPRRSKAASQTLACARLPGTQLHISVTEGGRQ